MYHGIVDDERLPRALWTFLHVRRFRRQLELLDRWGFTTVTFRDLQLEREGRLTLPAKPVILTFDDGYLNAYTHALPLLVEFGMKAVFFVLGDRKIRTNSWDAILGYPTAPLLDNGHILEMNAAGFEIGSHSMSHQNLCRLPGERVWREVVHSRIHLELLLDAPVLSFAYPYGAANGVAKRMVREAGYGFACGVMSGPVAFDADPHEIRRITIHSNVDSAGFALRMLVPYNRYTWLRWKLGDALRDLDPSLTGAGNRRLRTGKV
jgi:peptidoglycan/xylan/chitin deacetylase (PgdA/CDA1 family)